MKWIPFLAAMIISIIALSSCSFGNQGTAYTDENGNVLELKLSEITEGGFYVFDKKKQLFTPIMSGGDETGGKSIFSIIPGTESTDDQYIWAGTKTADLFKLIPTIDGKNRRLVIIQKSQDEMPDSYDIKKYKYLGFTIGAEFTFGDTGDTLFLDGQNVCRSSMANDILKGYSEDLMRIYKINDNEKLPKKNVDRNINVLLGLEKNKKYKVEFFDGTQYAEEDFVADTAVFRYKGETLLNDPLEFTEDSFFYIKLPPNLKNGYYTINDMGMFRFKAKEKK